MFLRNLLPKIFLFMVVFLFLLSCTNAHTGNSPPVIREEAADLPDFRNSPSGRELSETFGAAFMGGIIAVIFFSHFFFGCFGGKIKHPSTSPYSV